MSKVDKGIWGQARLAVAIATLITASGAMGAKKVKLEDYKGAVKPDALFIVDCLLPSQVRQLGQKFTYLAPRRPIKTSAQDCAVRGGEYVAFDRASYATALKVWLPAAKSGEAEAQTYVGEIYEDGLGVEPDFELAVQWYEKAAKQGHARAMINLGNLYEGGRGVPRDMTRAMNLYRAASGLTEGTLELTTEEEILRRRIQVEEADKLRRQVMSLTERLAGAERTIERRRSDLQRVRSDLAETLEQLAVQTMQQPGLSATERETLQRLRSDNETLRGQLAKAQSAYLKVQGDAQQANAVSTAAELEIQRLRNELATAESTLNADTTAAMEVTLESERALMLARQTALKQELQDAQRRLSDAEQQERTLRTQIAEQDREISTIRNSLASTEGELLQTQRVLAGSGEALDMVVGLEIEISEREAEIAEYEQSMQQLLTQLGVKNVATQTLAAADTDIEMISPQVAVTRGVRSVTLFSDVNEYELIGRVSPRNDLIAFKVNDRNALDEVDDSGIFQIRIPIAASGPTPVAIEAIRAGGSVANESFVIEKDTPPEVARRVVSAQFRGRMRADLGEYYALVIGNNNYTQRDPLSTAVNDAEGVAAVLRERYGYEVSLLTNASRDEMIFALATLSQGMGKNDNLLIYYAGHGVLDEEGEGFWLPVDAAVSKDESWIGNAQISDLLGVTEAKHVLVVADSCYSGTLSGTAIRPIPLDIDDQDLLFISRVKARTVLTSGGLQPVLDEGGEGHSIFGGAFIKAISENADLMEGYRLFDALSSDVARRSRVTRVQQNPQYSALRFSGHEGSEFFFLPARQVSSIAGPMLRL